MDDEKGKELTALDTLSHREQKALKYHFDMKYADLSPTVSARLFELYLNGKDCAEIQRLNPNFGMGAIVKAKVDGDWDLRKNEHLTGLLDGVRQRVQSVSLESINFLADMLAVTHKQYGDKLKRYLQTGNEAELEGIAITNIRQYKEVVDMIMGITGGGKKKIEGEILHKHVDERPVPAAARPVSGEQAGEILDVLIVKK